MYERIALNCFRYFGTGSIEEVDRMSLKEYRLKMKAHDLAQLDRLHEIHLQAWANQTVKATKGKSGKPKYKNFEQFFNFRAHEDKALQRVYKPTGMARGIAEYHRRKEHGGSES